MVEGPVTGDDLNGLEYMKVQDLLRVFHEDESLRRIIVFVEDALKRRQETREGFAS